MAGQSFPAYPQTGVSRPAFSYFRRPHPHHQQPHHPFRHLQPLTLRTMADSPRDMLDGQTASTVSSFASGTGATPLSSSTNGSSFFDEFFHYPEDSPHTGDIIGVPRWREQQHALHYLPFHASEIERNSAPAASRTISNASDQNSSSTGTGEVVVRKHDSSPNLHYHPVLSRPVDTSMYPIIQDDEWLWSSVENADALSPSSVDSQATRPYTPTSPIGGDSLLWSAYGSATTNTTFVPKVDNSSFGSFNSATSFGSFSSDFSQSCLSSAASFGALNQFGPFGQHNVAQGPSSILPPSVSWQGTFASHSHGLPMGGSNAGHSVTPHQIFPPPTTVLPELEHDYLETSPEISESDKDFESDATDQALARAHTRRDRDKFLLQKREEGWSYKKIKVVGKFREAESTLRGRVRVLTKHKSERVRSPRWTENDVSSSGPHLAYLPVVADPVPDHPS